MSLPLAEKLSHLFHLFGDAPAHRKFACGDCKRVKSCGLPPAQDCLTMHQIEQDWTPPEDDRWAPLTCPLPAYQLN